MTREDLQERLRALEAQHQVDIALTNAAHEARSRSLLSLSGRRMRRPPRTLSLRKQENPTIAYASAIDTQARMSRALGMREIPATFTIDPDGMIRWKGDPFLHHNADRNREMWDELPDLRPPGASEEEDPRRPRNRHPRPRAVLLVRALLSSPGR